ncbi:hypothetical protein [Sphingobacterium hotanense]|uniref:Immunity protein 30 domain-containing protein n=1 Tax=Sphingobacterium hotanense TaxID=649196 RepID=A0ABT7NNZ8_9SPHI|nr:hypothetical protein [Sphingobacterium hotanense]MDM1048874.1 hypothetical protein [Sphingobacterium hotanense]
MENSNTAFLEEDLNDRVKALLSNCCSSYANLESLCPERQTALVKLFDQIQYKDILDQALWSIGGGLAHYNLSLNEIKLSLLEILSTRSDDKERLILKELFLFLNILDEKSFYQINGIRQLMNCPEEVFDFKIEEIKGLYFNN